MLENLTSNSLECSISERVSFEDNKIQCLKLTAGMAFILGWHY